MSTLQSRIDAAADIYGQPPPYRRLTEREFDAWIQEQTRAEWVDGEVVMMAPANLDHDDVVWWFRSLVTHFVQRRRLGTVHGPEVLVRLQRIRRKRLPDVAFVATGRSATLKAKEIDGPPDLIGEVVSTDSIERDWFEKFDDYERAGVREYWVIDRMSDRVECFKLGAHGTYRATRLRDGRLSSTVLRGFYVRREWLLNRTLPDVLMALRELLGGE